MPATTQELDKALDRLASLFTNGTSTRPSGNGSSTQPPQQQQQQQREPQQGGFGGIGMTPSTPQVGGIGGIQPTTQFEVLLSAQQRAEIAKQVMYSMTLPLITPERAEEMERSLPQLVEMLARLRSSPVLKRRFKTMCTTALEQLKSTERGGGVDERVVALANQIQRDLGTEERFIPLVGVGVAMFMGAYTIVHNWDR